MNSALHHFSVFETRFTSSSAIAERTYRAAGWVSYGQKWKTGTAGREYFTDIIGLSSTTVRELGA